MKPLNITSAFEIYDSLEELPEEIQTLMKAAFKIRDQAYAPYSRFKVGAALELESGEVITGSNQENASYPSGLCAERTAVFYAGSQFPEEPIRTLVISAKSMDHSLVAPVPPCGSCRQSLSEYEGKQDHPIVVYFMGETGKVVKAKSVKDLLPLVFDSSSL